DLVVGWGSGNPPGELAALRRLGIPVYVSEPRHFRTIAHDLLALGRLAGTEDAARRAAHAFDRRLTALRRRYGARPPVTVFFQISTHPLITVTGEHIISAVLRLCGGRNIFAGLSGLAPQVSLEAVLAARPKAIVFSRYPGQDRHTMQAFWSRWQAVPAVRSGAIFGIPADLIARPTPRILDGAAMICRDLQKVRHP
ncbi:MAG: ABC transporter substrate-binding protein, partial [Gammaproteobacteria bacterium]